MRSRLYKKYYPVSGEEAQKLLLYEDRMELIKVLQSRDKELHMLHSRHTDEMIDNLKPEVNIFGQPSFRNIANNEGAIRRTNLILEKIEKRILLNSEVLEHLFNRTESAEDINYALKAHNEQYRQYLFCLIMFIAVSVGVSAWIYLRGF